MNIEYSQTAVFLNVDYDILRNCMYNPVIFLKKIKSNIK